MKRFAVSILSISMALSQILPMTIGQYIARTNDFCGRFDRGIIIKIYKDREKMNSYRLSEVQTDRRALRQMRGAFFARTAAYKARVRGCRNPIPSYFHFSRSRSV